MYVVATAGHVDHGKSTLVRALTGMEPDRWAEERRRGMTIDLGYAWTTLPSGAELAFVDVPGHQRFIANMLAGLGPAPAVLFVVAADEGWSRQSEEHLRAMDALDVRHAVLAVTRADLADPADTLARSRERIAGSRIGAVPGVVVSGRTGAGLAELRAALDQLVRSLPKPEATAPVRLWVDRSFTVRGSGTVVTGTLAAGTVVVGDELELRGDPLGVRGIQTLGRPQPRVTGAARVALNLRGVAVGAVARGDVLLTPGAWHRAATVDARIEADDDVPTHAVLHVGTAAIPVRIRTLGGDVARLTLVHPLPLRVHDRGVLRDPGGQSVVAGVELLDVDPPGLTRRGDAARRAQALSAAPPSAAGEVLRRGVVRGAFLARLGLPLGPEASEVRAVGDWLVSGPRWAGWLAAVGPALEEWARRDPLRPAMPGQALVHRLDLPATDLLAPLLAAAGYTVEDGLVGPARPAPTLGPAEASLRVLERRLAERPFAAPEADELLELGLGRRELAAAERAGRILRLPGDIVVLPTAVERACLALGELGVTFTLSEARQALGTTRRVAVPLLEHLDAQGRTERVDASARRVI